MSEKKEAVWLGTGKKNGNFRNVFVNLDKIEGVIVSRPKGAKDLPSHLFENKSGDLCVKITVMEKETPDNYGNDVAVKIDDFVPTKKS